MKYFLCAVFVSVFFKNVVTVSMQNQKTNDDEFAEKVTSSAIECASLHPLTLNEVTLFKSQIFPEGKNTNCFAACFFRKFGVMDSQGMISLDGAHKNAEVIFEGETKLIKFADDVMKICSAANSMKVENEECDRSRHLFECLVANAPAIHDVYADDNVDEKDMEAL